MEIKMTDTSGRKRHQLREEYTHEAGFILCMNLTQESLAKARELDVKAEDVLVTSYSKTGTTWLQELVWLICNDGDTTTANEVVSDMRIPFIEYYNSYTDGGVYMADRVTAMPHPWIIKTHMPPSFMKKHVESGAKILIVIRNPKDTLVSLYHFYRSNYILGNFEGPWDEFFDLFREKHMFYGDFFDWYMSWLSYINERPNVKLIKYEDMQSNMGTVFDDIAHFLGKSFSDNIKDRILHHVTFDQMKSNKMTNKEHSKLLAHDTSPFIRKGHVGDWKNYFSKEQSDFVDKRYQETLAQAGITLRFE